jgi:hypothetical protein
MRTTTGIRFRERTKGILACGPSDRPLTTFNGLKWRPLSIDLAARIDDLQAFIDSDEHRVGFDDGTVESGHFGTCRVTDAEIHLLVRGPELDERELRYRICFRTPAGTELTLFGYKDIKGSRFRVWYDTTRIFVEVYQGALKTPKDRMSAKLAAFGVVEIPLLTFLLQLGTIRAVAVGAGPWIKGYIRFVWWFSFNLTLPYWVGLRRRLGGGYRIIDTATTRADAVEWAEINLVEPDSSV